MTNWIFRRRRRSATSSATSPALVTHAITSGAAGGTTTAKDTTGATLLVLAIAYNQFSGAPTVSDSKSNIWTPLTAQGSTNVHASRIYYAQNPTVGTGHTFTIAGASSNSIAAMLAFSNTKTASVFDAENTAFGNSATTSLQPGSVTPSANGAVIVTLVALDSDGTNVPAIGSGFTITDAVAPFSTAGADGLSAAYFIQPTAAAINPTWTWGVNDFPSANIAAFKAA